MEGERGSERPNEHFWSDPHAKLNIRVGSDGSPKPQEKSHLRGQTDKQTDKQEDNFLQPAVAKREFFFFNDL